MHSQHQRGEAVSTNAVKSGGTLAATNRSLSFHEHVRFESVPACLGISASKARSLNLCFASLAVGVVWMFWWLCAFPVALGVVTLPGRLHRGKNLAIKA